MNPSSFVGHSQGGAIALDLAGNKQVKEKYNVVSVLTAGAPTAGVGADVDVPVLNLENLSDIVPSLDGAPADAGSRDDGTFDPRHSQVLHRAMHIRYGRRSSSDTDR